MKGVGVVDGDHCILDGDPAFFAELAQGAGDGFAGGAGHGGHFFVGQQEREAESAIDALADLMAEFVEETAEASGDGFCESDAAGVLESEAVFLADALHGAHLGFFVGAQEVLKAVALDGAELGGREGFGGDFVDAVGKHRIEAEHGAGSSDADDHLAFLAAAGGELDVSTADEIEAASVVALGEEGRLGRQRDGAGGEFEIGEHRAAEGAEPAGTAVGAGGAADG